MADDDRPGFVLVEQGRHVLVPNASEVLLGHRHDLVEELRPVPDPHSPVRPMVRDIVVFSCGRGAQHSS